MMDPNRIVHASAVISAPAATIFALIADPARQPEWDGNDNLASAAEGQRVHAVGDTFAMATKKNVVRINRVVEFEEGRRIAWKPSAAGEPEPGHLWRWELAPQPDGSTLATHTYDWSKLTDENRMERARWTTSERLMASITRLKALAESKNWPPEARR
jgi:uncharacterized protein YndB with AHSA1/START domain